MGVALDMMVSFLSILSVLGVIGNAVVIFTILRNFRVESWTFLLICHLATSDLLVNLIGAPLWIATYVTKMFPICRTAIFVSTFLMIISSLTLVLIAYDRYMYIKYPLRYSLAMTKRRIVTILIAIWTVSFGSALSSVVLGIDLTDKVKMRKCVMSTLVNRWVVFWIFIILTIVPITALMFAYSYILRTALRQQRTILPSGQVEKKAQLRKERRTMVTLTAVVFIYFICIMPYAVVGFLDALNPEILKKVKFVYFTSLILYINSAINPIVYTATNKQLRRQVYNAFRIV